MGKSDTYNAYKSDLLWPVLWVLGFVCALPVLMPYELARLAAVGLILTAGAGVLLSAVPRAGGLAYHRSLFLLLMALFGASAAASALWSVAPFASLIALTAFLLLPLSVLCFVAARTPDRFFIPVLYGAAAVMAALALWAVYQYFFLPDMLVGRRVRIPFANPNLYGALMALGYFMALGAFLEMRRRRWRIAAGAACLLFLAAVFVTGGRAPLLALGGGTVLLALLEWRTVFGQSGRMAAGLLALAGAALFIFFSLIGEYLGQAAPAGQLSRLGEGGPGTFAARLDLWQATRDMIYDYGLWGAGIGTFVLLYPAYRHDSETYSGGLMAHNDALQFAAEWGLAGPVLFYGLLVVLVWRMIRYLRAAPPGTPRRALVSAIFCGFLALCVHSHVSFPFYVASILALAGLLLAFWFVETGKILGGRTFIMPPLPAPLGRTGLQLLLLLPLLLWFFTAQEVLRSSYHSAQAKVAVEAGDMESYAAHVNAAGLRGFGLNDRAYEMAAHVPLAVLEAQAGLLPLAEQKAQFERAQALLDQAQARNARLPTVPFYRARLLLALDNDYLARTREERETQALEYLEKALAWDPLYLPARMALADFYERRGDQRAAYEVLKQGLHWRYRAGHEPQAYFQRMVFMAMHFGDEETADKVWRGLRRYSTSSQAVD